jgi:hypothetical protein
MGSLSDVIMISFPVSRFDVGSQQGQNPGPALIFLDVFAGTATEVTEPTENGTYALAIPQRSICTRCPLWLVRFPVRTYRRSNRPWGLLRGH